jgi:pyrroline-5-carboxylate reductase
MKKFAEKLELDKDIEERFAVQTVYGSGRMLDVTKEFAVTLKESEISKWND